MNRLSVPFPLETIESRVENTRYRAWDGLGGTKCPGSRGESVPRRGVRATEAESASRRKDFRVTVMFASSPSDKNGHLEVFRIGRPRGI